MTARLIQSQSEMANYFAKLYETVCVDSLALNVNSLSLNGNSSKQKMLPESPIPSTSSSIAPEYPTFGFPRSINIYIATVFLYKFSCIL